VKKDKVAQGASSAQHGDMLKKAQRGRCEFYSCNVARTEKKEKGPKKTKEGKGNV